MSENEKSWQDELVERYPKLFEHAYPSVGEGWKDILDVLCSNIKHYIEWRWESEYQENSVVIQDGEEPPEDKEWITQPQFAQIKEKFGTGRFYYYGGDDYVRGLVDLAESMTRITCEECGDPGRNRDTAWIRTLCDGCYENWEQIRAAKWKHPRSSCVVYQEGGPPCPDCEGEE